MLIAILHCLKNGSMYNVGAYHTLNAIIYIYIYIKNCAFHRKPQSYPMLLQAKQVVQ